MPLDPYSLCPGGRDKKIRFCCPDMVKEIEQIERLLESNQAGACLSFIETLEKDHKDCACLTAAKLAVYRHDNRWMESLALGKEFFEKEPDNPVAAAEYALSLAVTGQAKEAVSTLIDSYERAKEGTAHSSLINATLQIGAVMLVQGVVLPVFAIGNQLKRFPSAQEQANALLYRASSSPEIPLMLRDMLFEQECPDDFPGKVEFEDAMELLCVMRWKSGLAKLENLTQYANTWPNIWRVVAAVRYWLVDNEAGSQALQTYASLPNTLLEDAVDAESTRLFLTPDALGDTTDMLFMECPVEDAEKIQEILLSNGRFYSITINSQTFLDRNTPPPKGAFVLLDRPFPKEGEELTLDNVASQIGSCLLFGKETDRSARLEIMDVLTDERSQIEELFKEALGDAYRAPEKVETIRTISKTRALVQYRFRYTPEAFPPPEVLQKLEKDYYDQVFVDTWCRLPLGLLDGKAPMDAVSDPTCKIRTLAAIQVIENWISEDVAAEVANKVREKLGLPILGPLPIPNVSEEEMLGLLDGVPVWRWYRFDVQKLPTILLIEGLQVVSLMKEPRATSMFAKEILDRPSGEMPMQARMLAYESLIGIARGANHLEEALSWIEKAKAEAAEFNIGDAGLCLHEIPVRLALGQVEEVQEQINYLVKNYGSNEQVMQALHGMFVQLGFLNPDGTPTAAMARAQSEEATQVADGIWTPDVSAAPTGDIGSKLWTPD